MSKNDQLHELIHSMDMSEKRYFKLFSDFYSQKNKQYVQLFDVIENQKGYNKQLVLKQSTIKEDRLAWTKNYLYNLILKSMRLYNMENSKRQETRSMIEDIEFLMKKRLFSQAKKILNKAKAQVEKHEFLEERLMIHNLELNIGNKSIQSFDYKVKHNELKECISLLSNNQKFYALYQEMYHLAKTQNIARTEKQKSRLKNILKKPDLQDEGNALTGKAKIHFHQTHLTYYMVHNDIPNYNKHLAEKVKIMESDTLILKEDPARYIISGLIQMLPGMATPETYEDYKDLVKKINKVTQDSQVKNNEFIQLYAFVFTRLYEIKIHMNTNNTNALKSLCDELTEVLESLPKVMDDPTVLVIHSNLVYAYFLCGEFQKCQQITQKIFALNAFNESRIDVCNKINLFYIIINYEMKNFELLVSSVNSAYRIFKKKEVLYPVEKVLLKNLKKLPETKSPTNERKHFTAFRKELIATKKDPYSKEYLEYFDLISWLESKLERKSYGEILKEKYTGKRKSV